ncbi:MAG: type VI secretion system lipoprotein TssJ [Cellvibrionaceae bacterium]|nr:type VI secretion system lipoprotein TssJ [Cellvibrionaceae bacterium]
MNINKIKYIIFIVFLLGISACAVTAKIWQPYDDITIEASTHANMDNNNRPSPIQIKIYELRSRSTFDNLDFDRAFYHAATLLSDQLLSEASYTIQPGELIKHRVNLQKKAKFIAISASFIDIDNARWKHIYKIKDHGHYTHNIKITERRIDQGKIIKKTINGKKFKQSKDINNVINE